MASKLELQINQRKTKYMIVEQKDSSEQYKIGQLTIKNYTCSKIITNKMTLLDYPLFQG